MRLFMCFGGSASVVDNDDDAAVVAARRRRHQRGSSSFRGKFLSGSRNDNMKKPSAAAATSPLAEAKKLELDAGADAYGLIPAPTSAAASSAALSSLASLDSSSSSASSSSSRSSALASCSSVSSSPSVSGALSPPPEAKRQESKAVSTTTTSPAAGAAAVALCLLMVVFCGRVGATVLTSTALYLFPRRWPARSAPAREEDAVLGSLECDTEEETTAKRKVVTVTERGCSW